ncbi:aldo/keto reductase [Halalkalibacter nanhaiisediminis]|uniref:Aryl-alcohol dehydrogenase-like predicted oxidoreductase n=1 Tax=Halalkalibacter nanhaiisediminis TaxID=688079 RepID=A0A562QLP2_9BACI|nr:aldo/keto reductase [Halalkalibacter nanhaiisediminis]TWI57110.1 aryl-alcohol dehydrogenase-like predicted oxidoreductase [Halalkalibacter nanhaiisediminis]
MKKRQLGQSDLYVSEIGLGCMSIGTNKNEAAKIIDTALDGGINYLDTADLYDQGMNEEMIGDIIKSKRKELIIATKAGNRFEKGNEGWTWDPSKKHIQAAVKDSLQRLKTDYIDLYQLHGGTIEDNIDETIEAFEELKQEGIIRYYGISSIRPNVIKEYVKRSSIISIMMQYSLLDRRPEELFPLLEQHKVSVVARGPLAKGILTERPLTQLSKAIAANGYLDYSFDELITLRNQLEEGLEGKRTLQSAALKYCLSSSVIASVVAGASNPQQIEESIEAVNDEPLTENEQEWLARVSKPNKYEQHRS